jgi:hypothetical protein
MRRFWQKLSSFVWWSYPRGSVEYDVMVAIILVFIFLTPRSAFRDRPQPFSARPVAVTVVSAAHGHVYEILGAGPGANIEQILQSHLGHPVHIRKVELVNGDSESAVIYNVWTD